MSPGAPPTDRRPAPPTVPAAHFRDLDRVIDEVHALFDGWAEAATFAPALDAEGLDVLRLAVHEWVANLVQHGSFPGPGDVWLRVEAEGDAVRCAIEDTSVGFDFSAQVERQRAILDRPAPSERGRGLLMLITCADDLGYRPARAGVNQRVTFTVRGAADGALGDLFRPADAAPADVCPAHPLPSGDGAAGDGVLSAGVPAPPRPPAR